MYSYGDVIHFNDFQGEGVLCIGGYEGWTKLNKEETKKLGETLIAWSNT